MMWPISPGDVAEVELEPAGERRDLEAVGVAELPQAARFAERQAGGEVVGGQEAAGVRELAAERPDERGGGEAGAPNGEKPVVWTPNRIAIAGGSRQLSGDYSTLCALKVDGKVACWGDPLGTSFEKMTSGEVPDISDVTAIAVGYSHSCALRQDRTVWCWGKDEAGQLGDGGGQSSVRPMQVTLPGRATVVAAASKSTCARLEDRRWYCWGDNTSGQIGSRTQPLLLRPTLLDLSQVDLAGQ